jgi:hypothetical protein
MLEEVAESAVSELFLGFRASAGATLLVEAAATNEANWFIEAMILNRLAEAGYSAYLKDLPLGPAIPPEIADSLAAAEGLTGDDEDLPVETDLIFRYRIVEFGLSYPDSYRKSPLGSRQVQRLAAVSVQARLLAGPEERVVWVGAGDATQSDVVPSNRLELLEGEGYPFTEPLLETKGLSGLVEPALVTAIVAGLIYLFYTNQN